MTRRWILVVATLLLVPACGMSVGLRPVPSDLGESSSLAAPAPSTAPITASTVATDVAGVTMTTLTGTTTVGGAPTTTASTAVVAPQDTTTTTDDDAGNDATTSTTVVSVETTATSVVDQTTTTEDVPPSSQVSIPDFPDIGTVFSDDDAFLTHACGNGDVTITGNAGTYTLEGDCGALLVKGSFNTVFLDSVDVIDLTGTLNAVIYGAGNPTINDWDGENIVTGG